MRPFRFLSPCRLYLFLLLNEQEYRYLLFLSGSLVHAPLPLLLSMCTWNACPYTFSSITHRHNHTSTDRADRDTVRPRGVLVPVSGGVCAWSCTLAISPVSVPCIVSEWTGPHRSHVVHGSTTTVVLFSFSLFFLHSFPTMPCHFVLSQHPGVERQFAVAGPGASPSLFSLAAPMSMVVLSLLFSLLPAHWLRAFLCCPKGKVLFGTFPVLSAHVFSSRARQRN
ncbi:hypothetical protein V8F06_004221 [Rhypophila decipiens]